jgi:hypothetical protein
MAAVTGATATIARPGRRKVGAKVRQKPEASSLTFPVGALLALLNGSVSAGSTGQLQSTGLLGLAINSGQNLTANGLKNCTYFAFEKGEAIKLTFAVSNWTGSAHRGITAGLSMDTNGSVVVKSGGASTCGTIIDAVDWDSGLTVGPVADGDVNPVVYFVLADTAFLVQ